MNDEKYSKPYATAIYQLGKEQNVNVADELTRLTELINANNNLETLMFSDLFTIEEKTDILTIITEKLNSSALIKTFLNFLLAEKRINIFPLIYKNIMVLDDNEKGFLRGTIEGSDEELSVAFRTKLTSYLEEKMGKKTQLDYIVNTSITAGYKVTVGDLQLDASLDNQLNKFKETVLN